MFQANHVGDGIMSVKFIARRHLFTGTCEPWTLKKVRIPGIPVAHQDTKIPNKGKSQRAKEQEARH